MFDHSHLLSSTLFPLCSSPFAVLPLQFPEPPLHLSLRGSALVCLHLPLRVRSFFCVRSRVSALGKYHCRTLLAIHPWANIIARLRLRSTLRQTSLQDFARNPSLAKHQCKTLLAIHPWPKLIAGLCPRSTFGQPDLSLTDLRSALVPLHSKLCPFIMSTSLCARDSSDW